MSRRTFRSTRREDPGGLTGAQREILTLGYVMICHDEPGFSTPADEQAAWQAHRAELLDQAGPGRRPWAFWKYDMDHPDPEALEWWDEFRLLDAKGLITPDEKLRFEAVYIRGKAPTITDPVEMAAGVISNWRHYRYGEHVTRHHANECEFRAEWYRAKGEEATAQFCELVAAGLRELLNGDKK